MVIHSITIAHGLDTYVFRFTAENIAALRFKLAQHADLGHFPYDAAFEANRQIQSLIPTGSEMEEIEKLRSQWLRLGFNFQINSTADGWDCLLWNSITFRPPHGRAETLFKAMALAELDRIELMKTAKHKV